MGIFKDTNNYNLNEGADMFKKKLIAFAVLVTGTLGMLLSCNNDSPTSPSPSLTTDINGTWTGLTSVASVGAGHPDTFTCVLKIDNAGTYNMQRGHVCYGSSGSTVDSTKETGTWAKIGTDSLVLTANGTSCNYYDPGLAQWVLADGSVDAMFRTCPDPLHIKINISDNQWTASMVRYDDPKKSVNYTLKK